MIILDHEPGSPHWRAARCGIITASALEKITTPAKLGPSKQVDGYLDTLAAEWLLGQPLDTWKGSFWTERGTAMEPEARMAFQVATGYHTHEVGFILRHEDAFVGASPDSLVLDQPVDIARPAYYACGVLELKCPRLDTHIGYWRVLRETGEMPTEYRLQVQGQLWVTGLSRAWFQSYHPDGPEVLIEVAADLAVQDALSEHVPAAVERLQALHADLRAAGCEPRDPYEWADAQDLESSEWEGAA